MRAGYAGLEAEFLPEHAQGAWVAVWTYRGFVDACHRALATKDGNSIKIHSLLQFQIREKFPPA